MKKFSERFAVTTWAKISGVFLIWKTFVLLGTYLGKFVLVDAPDFSSYREPRAYFLPYIWQKMSNFDGQHYLAIAAHGYQQLTQAFFPLYPFLIASLAYPLQLPFIVSALIVSHFSFLLALYIVWRLCMLDGQKNAWWVWGIIILFPTAVYYGAVYNDALFFCFATMTLWLGCSHKWWAAGVFGALATLTRLNGLALFPFLLVEFLETLRADRTLLWYFPRWVEIKHIVNRLRLGPVMAMFLIPLAFIGYLAFHQLLFGSWHVVFGNMSIWQQDKVTLPPQVLWRYIKILWMFHFGQYQYWVACLEFGSVIFYLSCLIWGWQKIRPSYWIFIATSICIPWLTGTFQGMPRYGLHLYPLFLVIALFLADKPQWMRVLYFSISIALFLFYTAFFTRGYFVA